MGTSARKRQVKKNRSNHDNKVKDHKRIIENTNILNRIRAEFKK